MISGVRLLDLQHSDCRFPLDGGLFCAARRRDNGSSYCEHHHRIAYPLAGGGRAFTAGGFLADSVETVAPPRAARAHEFAPPRTSAPDPALLDQFVRAAAARRDAAPEPVVVRPPRPPVVLSAYVAPVSTPETHEAREVFYLAGLARQCDNIVSAISSRTIRGFHYAIDMRDHIASMLGMSTDELLCNRRTRDLVQARQFAMFCIAKGALKLSLPDIGQRIFGGFDHTTVLHARDKTAARIADGSLPARLTSILNRICAFDAAIADAVRKASAQRADVLERESA